MFAHDSGPSRSVYDWREYWMYWPAAYPGWREVMRGYGARIRSDDVDGFPARVVTLKCVPSGLHAGILLGTTDRDEDYGVRRAGKRPPIQVILHLSAVR